LAQRDRILRVRGRARIVRRTGLAGIAEGRRQLEAVRAGLDRVVGRAIDETANWGAAARGVNNFVTGFDGGEVIRQEDLVTDDVVPVRVNRADLSSRTPAAFVGTRRWLS